MSSKRYMPVLGGVILSLLACASQARAEDHVVITDVVDTALRDRAYAGWNFGAGPLLEAGFMGGIYETHHAASLIRFNLASRQGAKVTSAKLRLYRPKSFVQMTAVEVRLLEVPVGTAWQEGRGISEVDPAGACWTKQASAHAKEPLARQTVSDGVAGGWVEFDVPVSLVQRWIDRPETNAGFYVDAALKHDGQWGEHVFFHSREHWAGDGPQLVVDGTSLNSRDARSRVAATNPAASVYQLPPEDAKFDQWLAAKKRLAAFTVACSMSRDQARLFYYFDTTVRTKLIQDRYQKPLFDTFKELDELVKANGDERAVHERLDRVLRYMLVWEYIRETSWYTAGPVAELLSPRQLGKLFGDEIFGRMQEAADEKHKPIWQAVGEERIDAHCRAAMEKIRKELQLSQAQFDGLARPFNRYERLENQYLAKFVKDLADVRARVARGDDSPAMYDAVRSMETDHEQFLYYQSMYNTPRWTLYSQFAPPIPFAKQVVEARRAHYERQLGKRSGDADDAQ